MVAANLGDFFSDTDEPEGGRCSRRDALRQRRQCEKGGRFARAKLSEDSPETHAKRDGGKPGRSADAEHPLPANDGFPRLCPAFSPGTTARRDSAVAGDGARRGTRPPAREGVTPGGAASAAEAVSAQPRPRRRSAGGRNGESWGKAQKARAETLLRNASLKEDEEMVKALLKHAQGRRGPLVYDAERNEGNVEYKLFLTQLTPAKLAHRTTQMKYRMQEGAGVCFYLLGVADGGLGVGISSRYMRESLDAVARMAAALGASAAVVGLQRVAETEADAPHAAADCGLHGEAGQTEKEKKNKSEEGEDEGVGEARAQETKAKAAEKAGERRSARGQRAAHADMPERALTGDEALQAPRESGGCHGKGGEWAGREGYGKGATTRRPAAMPEEKHIDRFAREKTPEGARCDWEAILENEDETSTARWVACVRVSQNQSAALCSPRPPSRGGAPGARSALSPAGPTASPRARDLRIAVLGAHGVGKSSLVAVLADEGTLDDGEGSARLQLCTHPHEVLLGATSALHFASLPLSLSPANSQPLPRAAGGLFAAAACPLPVPPFAEAAGRSFLATREPKEPRARRQAEGDTNPPGYSLSGSKGEIGSKGESACDRKPCSRGSGIVQGEGAYGCIDTALDAKAPGVRTPRASQDSGWAPSGVRGESPSVAVSLGSPEEAEDQALQAAAEARGESDEMRGESRRSDAEDCATDISLLDMAGHPKYIKSSLTGLLCECVAHVVLVVDASAEADPVPVQLQQARVLLATALLLLRLPFTLVFNKWEKRRQLRRKPPRAPAPRGPSSLRCLSAAPAPSTGGSNAARDEDAATDVNADMEADAERAEKAQLCAEVLGNLQAMFGVAAAALSAAYVPGPLGLSDVQRGQRDAFDKTSARAESPDDARAGRRGLPPPSPPVRGAEATLKEGREGEGGDGHAEISAGEHECEALLRTCIAAATRRELPVARGGGEGAAASSAERFMAAAGSRLSLQCCESFCVSCVDGCGTEELRRSLQVCAASVDQDWLTMRGRGAREWEVLRPFRLRPLPARSGASILSLPRACASASSALSPPPAGVTRTSASCESRAVVTSSSSSAASRVSLSSRSASSSSPASSPPAFLVTQVFPRCRATATERPDEENLFADSPSAATTVAPRPRSGGPPAPLRALSFSASPVSFPEPPPQPAEDHRSGGDAATALHQDARPTTDYEAPTHANERAASVVLGGVLLQGCLQVGDCVLSGPFTSPRRRAGRGGDTPSAAGEPGSECAGARRPERPSCEGENETAWNERSSHSLGQASDAGSREGGVHESGKRKEAAAEKNGDAETELVADETEFTWHWARVDSIRDSARQAVAFIPDSDTPIKCSLAVVFLASLPPVSGAGARPSREASAAAEAPKAAAERRPAGFDRPREEAGAGFASRLRPGLLLVRVGENQPTTCAQGDSDAATPPQLSLGLEGHRGAGDVRDPAARSAGGQEAQTPPAGRPLRDGERQRASRPALRLPQPVAACWCRVHVLAHPSALRRFSTLAVYAHAVRQAAEVLAILPETATAEEIAEATDSAAACLRGRTRFRASRLRGSDEPQAPRRRRREEEGAEALEKNEIGDAERRQSRSRAGRQARGLRSLSEAQAPFLCRVSPDHVLAPLETGFVLLHFIAGSGGEVLAADLPLVVCNGVDIQGIGHVLAPCPDIPFISQKHYAGG
ncbi:hypothetical protein BESB_083750 [Besnoitia besnoiti]|uniref:Tr-type G domain-containing protein n=1 Tax=Besnoitia besnoiti TaxID=94643 RepID=A0A2A9MB71_BESBE|nr:hypothetical protein BESB_083750 [Besnoitia besnoiti]PFH33176.1 hypothetical protein BESB_083750 [Besnoitia besnoiti]